jgi:hypothetical protein
VAIAELRPEAGRGVFVQKQRANVYSMMLILSLMFIMIGCLCLYLEMNSYQMKVRVPGAAKAAQVPKPVEPPNPAGLPGM